MRLDGCGVNPIGDYLKALGVLKILAEQADHGCMGFWKGDYFHLGTSLSKEDIIDFMSESYSPTPILAPWNGGNGLNPKSISLEWSQIVSSDAPRLADYSQGIQAALEIMRKSEEIDDKLQKSYIMRSCRNTMGDRALEWIDSAYIELDKGDFGYPPITGTGGNDGRMDFTRNFAKSVTEVMDSDGNPTSNSLTWLKSSLFGEIIDSVPKKNVGMYRPFSVGGYNQSSVGYQTPSFTNPWDFILMIEGLLMMNSSAVRKLESHEDSMLASPWTVRHSGVGFPSAFRDDGDVRAEIWLPLWENPSRISDVRGLMSEGRVEPGRRPARNGIDFLQAVSQLGVDRGVYRFHRYVAAERNGQAYLILSAGKTDVFRRDNMDLVSEITPFVDRLRRLKRGESISEGLLSNIRALESSLVNYMTDDCAGNLLEILLCVGDCHLSLGRSLGSLIDSVGNIRVQPIKPLSHKWLVECYDGSPEYRLASSLASIYSQREVARAGSAYYQIRENIFPMKGGRWDTNTREVSWLRQDLISSLISIMDRRLAPSIESSAVVLDRGNVNHGFEDVSLFLGGHLSFNRISRLTAAFSLVRQERGLGYLWRGDKREFISPPANYSVLKLCHSNVGARENSIRLDKKIFQLLRAGRSAEAVKLACRRLDVSGFPVPSFRTPMSNKSSRMLAASLLIPDNPWMFETMLKGLVPDVLTEVEQ